jgi:hypothetical protein
MLQPDKNKNNNLLSDEPCNMGEMTTDPIPPQESIDQRYYIQIGIKKKVSE